MTRAARAKARSDGFDLHAGRPIGRRREDRREQLFRYLLRPALFRDRLHLTPEGRVLPAIEATMLRGRSIR